MAITTQGKDRTATLDGRFGRAQGFYIYDNEKNSGEYIDNTQNMNSPQGAGIQAAQAVIDAGVSILITGNVGPKAYEALNAAGIKIFSGAKGTVGDAIEDYRSGLLQAVSGANVEGHW